MLKSQPPAKFFVYAMLCQDGEGPLYVKFGHTNHLDRRLSALRSGSPIPAKYFAYIQVDKRSIQQDLEKALHQQFADRRTTGEWFKFDAKSDEDKADFNDGSIKQFLMHLGPGRRWEKVSVAHLDTVNRERRAAFLAAKKRYKGNMRAFRQLKQDQAWQELDAYR